MARSVPRKKETLLAYLARGIAMVHLDARRPGVVVPSQYAMDAHLRLNLSYRYGIPDLDITDQRIQATLSFGGRSFRCILPWGCVFGITSHGTGDGQVWPEDLPVEVVHTMADRQNGMHAPASGERASRTPRRRYPPCRRASGPSGGRLWQPGGRADARAGDHQRRRWEASTDTSGREVAGRGARTSRSSP